MLLQAKKDTKDCQQISSSQEDTKDTKGWGPLGRASASTSQSPFLPSRLSRFFSVAPVGSSVCCYPLHATGLQQTCEFITDVHSWPHAWRICVKASFYGILPHSVLSHAGTTPASLLSQTLCPLTPHQGRPWITKAYRLQQA